MKLSKLERELLLCNWNSVLKNPFQIMFSYSPIMCPREAHINPFWGHPLEKLFDIYKLPWEEISEKWSGLYHQRI